MPYIVLSTWSHSKVKPKNYSRTDMLRNTNQTRGIGLFQSTLNDMLCLNCDTCQNSNECEIYYSCMTESLRDRWVRPHGTEIKCDVRNIRGSQLFKRAVLSRKFSAFVYLRVTREKRHLFFSNTIYILMRLSSSLLEVTNLFTCYKVTYSPSDIRYH